MAPPSWSRVISIVIIGAVLAPCLTSGQGAPQSRPRRTQTSNASGTVGHLEHEPLIRIGLATDARAVTISSSGNLLNATDTSAPPVALSTSRLRLEARALSAQTLNAGGARYRVEVARFATRYDAERAKNEISEATDAPASVTLDSTTNTWRLQIGADLTATTAERVRAEVESAGYATAEVVTASPVSAGQGTNSVRPVSRASAPSREVVAFGAGSSRLFSTSMPAVFATTDDNSSPVRFNDKPYRGRLEVFANQRGALTVVNVLGIEDYVRGVVPNELSPGGYPAIEALKAQAIAARTYAIRNRNQFASQGFDLLPTTRSQVYGGLSTEHPLTDRAVAETRGLVATYDGQPINALYTSTCGGRTEDVENVFNEATPYLRGRECALEAKAHFSTFIVKSDRDLPDIRDEANIALARALALLDIHGLAGGSRKITDTWLSTRINQQELRTWLGVVARLARQQSPNLTDDATRSPGFSTGLAMAVFGESRADVLLSDADIEYILSFRDAGDIPNQNRADVAWLVREGFLSLFADATLRPREPMTRGRALQTIARVLESRGVFGLQRGTTRPSTGGALILRSAKNRDQPISVSSDAYLFRAFGENAYQVRSLSLVGGEPVAFHVNPRGEIDYLEVRPASSGAAADRSSPFAYWTATMSVAEAQSRLARWSSGIGTLRDLRVLSRGSSRRATDLAIVGTNGTNHVRRGQIRTALGLREQLFVIDRRYDDAGRVVGFVFVGRGWGHGVGMCQVGAFGLARQGLSFERILKTYYSNAEVTRMY